MRHASLFSCGVLTVFCGLIVGCQEPGLSTGIDEPSQAQIPPQSPQAQDADGLVADAQAQARRIANISAQLAPREPQEILWRDLAAEPQANTPIEPVLSLTNAVPSTPPAVTLAADTDEAIAEATAPAEAANEAQPRLSRAQAYNQLLKTIRQGDDSNLSKAITGATLSAVGPHSELDWSLITPLSPKDQERVQRYHKAIAALRDQALSPDGRIDQATVAGKLDEVLGNRPVTIRSIELCEKVLGYGVYDKFPQQAFPAGQDQKMIIYVELDHFRPALRTEGDGYEVRLRQELELYESNGFEVWNHEPVQIVDVSKNQRRDFFVVQLVTLPGQLALGQYHLKVRIYDENAGTRDEASIPIRIVANDTLVKKINR